MVAFVVMAALACAPATHVPVVAVAAAQEPTAGVYGPVPPALPPAPVTGTGAEPSSAVPLERSPSMQQLPDLGDPAQVGLSPAQERKIGEAIVRQIRAQGGYLQDPEVSDYLNELGHRLVAASHDTKQDFEFFAVPDPQINAFALPGGYIGVHTGLILLAQNESELASVLAHEISHVTQRHMARMMANQKNSMLMSLAGLALAILASRAGGSNSGQATQAAIAGSQALSAQNQLNFTRDNEYEADRIGFSRMTAAGCSAPIGSSKATRRRICARTPSPTSASRKPSRAPRACPTSRFRIRSNFTSCARCSRAIRATPVNRSRCSTLP